MSNSTKISMGTFVGIAMAMIATVRSIPTLASSGWQMIVYMLISVIFFALPISLMAGELSTLLQDEGGPQLWVKTGLNGKWGFVTSWLLWAQIFPGMVMVASTLGPLFGNTFGNAELGQNHWFTLACIIVVYWIIAILNLFFDMAKFGGNIGVWFGVYIPVAVMIIMGVAALCKTGIDPNSILGTFSWDKLMPQPKTMTYLAAIAFIFTGIETLGVYVPRLKNPARDAGRGIIVALIGIVFLNIINGFLVANAIPAKSGSAELTNISQPIMLFCQILGWPTWIVNIFSAMAAIGVVFQLSGWVTGPSQTMIQVAREGLVPSKWGFFKHNNIGVSKQVILTQTICITVFALMYAFPNINGVFLLLTNTTTLMFCVIYVLIALAFIRLRKTMPDAPRAFRVGKKGDGAAWVWAILFLIGIAFIAVVGVVTQGWLDGTLMVVVTAVLTIIPIVIYAKRDPQWLKDAQAYEAAQVRA